MFSFSFSDAAAGSDYPRGDAAGVFTPVALTLLPGFISGVTVVIGYGLWVLVQWTWDYLMLLEAHARNLRLTLRPRLAFILAYTASSIWWHIGWQNDSRLLCGGAQP